jgi:hypothetical protein
MRFQDTDGTWKNYQPSFTEEDKDKLEAFVQDHAYVVPMMQLETYVSEGSTDVVSIRHDVDHSIEHAMKFARWEYERGIYATYFVLHTAYYYSDLNALYIYLHELDLMGHEVGLHLDTVNQNLDENGKPDYAAAAAQLDVELLDLRNAGFRILGAAAHGNPKSTHNDTELFENRFALSYFGLKYEAYELQRRLNVNYISDNHGRWRAPLARIIGKPTVISMHPCHWPF